MPARQRRSPHALAARRHSWSIVVARRESRHEACDLMCWHQPAPADLHRAELTGADQLVDLRPPERERTGSVVDAVKSRTAKTKDGLVLHVGSLSAPRRDSARLAAGDDRYWRCR